MLIRNVMINTWVVDLLAFILLKMITDNSYVFYQHIIFVTIYIHPHYLILCNTTDWRWRIIKSLFCKPWFFYCNIQKAVLQMKYCILQLQESIETMRYTCILVPRWFWFGRRVCDFRSFIISREVKLTVKTMLHFQTAGHPQTDLWQAHGKLRRDILAFLEDVVIRK